MYLRDQVAIGVVSYVNYHHRYQRLADIFDRYTTLVRMVRLRGETIPGLGASSSVRWRLYPDNWASMSRPKSLGPPGFSDNIE